MDGAVPVADEVYLAYYILRREAEHTRIRTQAIVRSTPFCPSDKLAFDLLTLKVVS